MSTTTKIIGLKELRENTESYINKTAKGQSFIVVRKSKPVFRISPPDEDEGQWETIADFTKIRKGGIPVDELISRL
jgi:prevent-host-death family protein